MLLTIGMLIVGPASSVTRSVTLSSQPAHRLVVRQAGQRLRLIRFFVTKHPLARSDLSCRPRLLPKPTSAQSVASAGTIQLAMHGAAAPVNLPVSTIASKQLPDVTVVRMHNVPGGINVH